MGHPDEMFSQGLGDLRKLRAAQLTRQLEEGRDGSAGTGDDVEAAVPILLAGERRQDLQRLFAELGPFQDLGETRGNVGDAHPAAVKAEAGLRQLGRGCEGVTDRPLGRAAHLPVAAQPVELPEKAGDPGRTLVNGPRRHLPYRATLARLLAVRSVHLPGAPRTLPDRLLHDPPADAPRRFPIRFPLHAFPFLAQVVASPVRPRVRLIRTER